MPSTGALGPLCASWVANAFPLTFCRVGVESFIAGMGHTSSKAGHSPPFYFSSPSLPHMKIVKISLPSLPLVLSPIQLDSSPTNTLLLSPPPTPVNQLLRPLRLSFISSFLPHTTPPRPHFIRTQGYSRSFPSYSLLRF